ncbi:MAG TPA: hypothetical protein VFI97_02620, partial [Arthrobacter sp.]|nr:hypothetical protein [Arthrobacter sp.]
MLARHDRRTPRAVTFPPGVHLSRRWVGSLAFAVALIAILALTWGTYHPGLSGAFLFDDLGSLPKLGATGPVDNWATFWRYITSGSADPTGRPLALLSFLIDAHNWPANPYPFKVTNVILHLINGVLLAWVLWKLGRVLVSSGRAQARSYKATRTDETVGAGRRAAPAPSVPATGRAQTYDIPPALRTDPLLAEGGENPDASLDLPPPSARRGTEGDGSSIRGNIPPPLRGDPLPVEGGENRGAAIAA